MKKRIMAVLMSIISVIMVFGMFAGCGNNDDFDGIVNVVVVDGAPVLAVAELIDNNPEYEGYDITYEVVSGIDALYTQLSSGNADMAIAPTNTGAMYYNKYSALDIKLASTVVQGNVYIVGNDSEVTTFNDLVGEVVLGIGSGGTPDVTFKYLLEQHGIEWVEGEDAVAGKVVIKQVASGAVAMQALGAGSADFSVLAEPVATNAVGKNDTLSILMDMQEEWMDETGNDIPQASLFTTGALSDGSHDGFVEWFVDKVEEGSELIKDDADKLSSAIDAVKDIYETTSIASVTTEIFERCNISALKPSKSKDAVNTYLDILCDYDTELVGGAVPDAEFYFDF